MSTGNRILYAGSVSRPRVCHSDHYATGSLIRSGHHRQQFRRHRKPRLDLCHLAL